MNRRSLLVFLLGSCALVSCRRPGTPTLAPVDQSTQAALVSNVDPGAVVELWTNSPSGQTLTATSTQVPTGRTQIRVRLPSHLSPGRIVRARQRLSFRRSHFSAPMTVENNYVTNRYDNERSGWNPNESTLSVNKVRRGFGIICDHAVDAPIRAQPLYVQDVHIQGKGKHNVVFVATDSTDTTPLKGNQVWAFDAETCAPLWESTPGHAGPRELLGPGETIPLVACNGHHGVWSTPAIDRTTNTMYVVAAVQKGAQNFFRLHAIDIGTGLDRVNPVVMDGSTVKFTQGSTTVSLNPSVQNNRPGLLLDRGVLYVAFGSSCDVDSYHGWIVAYDADLLQSQTFLTQLGVFNTTPQESSGAGVWQSGLGVASDGDGTIYFLTGNGGTLTQPSNGSYPNSLVRLALPPAGSTSMQLQVVNSFTPADWDTFYNFCDSDLGAGGAVLFSDGAKHFILAGGKASPQFCSSGSSFRTQTYLIDRSTHSVIQTLTQTNGIAQGMVAGPAYYKGPLGTRIYYGFNFSPLAAFTFVSNPPHLVDPPEVTLMDPAPATSPIPTISSNGNAAGTGILWAVFHPALATQPLTLHAYDANDLHDNLLNRPGSTQMSLDIGDWVPLGNHAGNSFQVPTVIHGRVYCGSKSRLVVFGPRHKPLCSFIVDCGGAISFYCPKDSDSDKFQLERLQNGNWKNVTEPGSIKDLGKFVYLWDYPSGENAIYRVCSKDRAEDCTLGFTLRANHRPCDIAPEFCGRPGKPPCFLGRPWPVSSGKVRNNPSSRD